MSSHKIHQMAVPAAKQLLVQLLGLESFEEVLPDGLRDLVVLSGEGARVALRARDATKWWQYRGEMTLTPDECHLIRAGGGLFPEWYLYVFVDADEQLRLWYFTDTAKLAPYVGDGDRRYGRGKVKTVGRVPFVCFRPEDLPAGIVRSDRIISPRARFVA